MRARAKAIRVQVARVRVGLKVVRVGLRWLGRRCRPHTHSWPGWLASRARTWVRVRVRPRVRGGG